MGERAEIDAGQAPGVTTAEAQRIKDLEAEVRELRPGERDPEDGIGVLRRGGAPSRRARGRPLGIP